MTQKDRILFKQLQENMDIQFAEIKKDLISNEKIFRKIGISAMHKDDAILCKKRRAKK